jgi:hypothetical protein
MLLCCIVAALYSSTAKANHREPTSVHHRVNWLPKVLHLSQLVCIHGYEGAWNDPNGPYYGGLQMDLGFQATYARELSKKFHYPNLLSTKGTADHWTPKEQMWVAEMAIKTRGFWPWPNTARYCGLL